MSDKSYSSTTSSTGKGCGAKDYEQKPPKSTKIDIIMISFDVLPNRHRPTVRYTLYYEQFSLQAAEGANGGGGRGPTSTGVDDDDDFYLSESGDENN